MFVADVVQQALHGLVLVEFILGVEWQRKDVSFKSYDMLYHASNGLYSL